MHYPNGLGDSKARGLKEGTKDEPGFVPGVSPPQGTDKCPSATLAQITSKPRVWCRFPAQLWQVFISDPHVHGGVFVLLFICVEPEVPPTLIL